MEHLSSDHKDHLNQHKNSHKLYDETGHPNFEFDGKSMENETTTWSQFLSRGKAIAEQILASEDRNKFKRAGL